MRKTYFILMIFLAVVTSATAQINTGKILKDAKKEKDKILGGNTTSLSNEEVIRGLREALTVGTGNAASFASKVDGFNKNPKIRIPFPPEAIKVKNTAEDLGLHDQVNEFVLTLNRAAEEAAKEAAPVFISAIKGMSIQDGFTILKGEDNAATIYLKDKTNAELYAKFNPIVKNAINKVEVTKYWNPLITTYNKVPFAQKMNPDLEAYVTEKALEGLFILLAEEELKIRKDPAARVTDILKKVFG